MELVRENEFLKRLLPCRHAFNSITKSFLIKFLVMKRAPFLTQRICAIQRKVTFIESCFRHQRTNNKIPMPRWKMEDELLRQLYTTLQETQTIVHIVPWYALERTDGMLLKGFFPSWSGRVESSPENWKKNRNSRVAGPEKDARTGGPATLQDHGPGILNYTLYFVS